MEERPLKLVLSEDMEKLLDAIGILARIRGGEVRCVRCGRIVAADDISLIEATQSGYELTCSAGPCVDPEGHIEGAGDAKC